MSYAIRLAQPDDFGELASLFEREFSPCYCRYWHFGGTNKEWEARCGLAPHENRAELGAALERGSDEARGLVARVAGEQPIVGWMKLAPQRSLAKLLARSPYRGLDAPDTFSIGCFLVDAAHRRKGVARALLEGAITLAPSLGCKALEAYPRVFDGLHDFEQLTGPHALFVSLGFEVVRDQPQYPVLRRAV
jgi:GNAT superfamily N-acetyltransferase